MAISWTSTAGVSGELAETSLLYLVAFNCMKAPEAFCCGTVARTQASLTVTCAWAVAASSEAATMRSEERTSELQSQSNLVCRLLLEKKNDTVVLDRSSPNTTITAASNTPPTATQP